MQDWFKLYNTKNYLEANIIKGKLEENNIQAVILNRQDSSYLVIGEVEIYVPVYLKDIALHLLNNALFN
jgi:Putative prokaryotic signal transducing protein